MIRLEPGATFGRYALVERIGQGGFSQVWEARRDADGATVALKIVTDPARVDCVRREAATLERVAGPGVVAVIDSDVTHDPPYLALELLREGDLRRRLRAEGGRLPWPVALGVFEALIRTLEPIHRQGVVHGDLKPENVLFRDGRPCLADFALSADAARATASLSLSRSVSDARIAGTLPYMAPELREGERPTPAADVFAMAVVLYEMLVGIRPEGAFVRPTAHDPELPGFIEDIVLSGLESNPRDRISDAGTLVRLLEKCRADAVALARQSPRTIRSLVVPCLTGTVAGVPIVLLITHACERTWFGRGLSPLTADVATLGAGAALVLVGFLGTTLRAAGARRARTKAVARILDSRR